jgi:hypothetical protein
LNIHHKSRSPHKASLKTPTNPKPIRLQIDGLFAIAHTQTTNQKHHPNKPTVILNVDFEFIQVK